MSELLLNILSNAIRKLKFMSNYQERFAEEIERVGGVSAVASSLGVARNTIYNWIAKGNVPLASLMGLASLLGVDVNYVLTGQRSSADLSTEESLLLSRYRQASPAVKLAVQGALLGGTAPAGSTFVTHGNVGQVIHGDVVNTEPLFVGGEPKKRK
ncbi:helix-turn-helix domain-containing protein [Cupriavidus metallidurans]|uniref:helix-turn-helix domain-containing protein n=1 Tax=Cupriavidus metallidurans TaxID=119219 RepID=UPI0006887843|nr:helix-turn-helix domain-containing protein [Cupriavidus metallidurans]